MSNKFSDETVDKLVKLYEEGSFAPLFLGRKRSMHRALNEIFKDSLTREDLRAKIQMLPVGWNGTSGKHFLNRQDVLDLLKSRKPTMCGCGKELEHTSGVRQIWIHKESRKFTCEERYAEPV
jgi:hypothetical protein